MIFYHWKRATHLNINVNDIFKSKRPGNVGRKSSLLTFGIEVPGNVRDKALAFIDKICKFASPTGSLMESKFLTSKLISILSISLMKYNALIIQSGRILLNLPSTNNPTDCLTQSQ